MLGFEDILLQLDARVSKGDSFEVDELALLELDIDNWPLVTHDDDLRSFVLLFNRNAWFRDWPFASVDAFSQPDDGVWLAYLERLFKTLDWPFLSIDLVNMGVFEALEHLIVDIFGGTIQIL